MKIKMLARSLRTFLFVGVITGVLLGVGAGLVSADAQNFNLLAGTYNYDTTHSGNGGGYSWLYNLKSTIYNSSDHTYASVNYTKRYGGIASANTAMGTFYIWDEQGNNSKSYLTFYSEAINNINHEIAPNPSWYYGSLSANDRCVTVQQNLIYFNGFWNPLDVDWNEHWAF